MFSSFLITNSIILFLHYLILDVSLLCDQALLSHDLSVKDGSFLLEAGFEEPLTHHLNYFVDNVGLQTSEFDPFSGEAGPHLDSVLQVQAVVLGAAVNREKKLAHTHLIAASIFEDRDHDENDEQVGDHDEHRAPVTPAHSHANRDGYDEGDQSGDGH